jgi:hypothetical protein
VTSVHGKAAMVMPCGMFRMGDFLLDFTNNHGNSREFQAPKQQPKLQSEDDQVMISLRT